MKRHILALTGGECSGKTTMLAKIQEYFTNLGWSVKFVPEAATLLDYMGFAPRNITPETAIPFQVELIKMQQQLENHTITLSKHEKSPVLIVCDRGCIDGKAYCSPDQWQTILNYSNITESELLQRYDSVIHLTTTAIGAVEHYTCTNNLARHQSPEQAAVNDHKLVLAWTGHPRRQVIENNGDFAMKIKNTINSVTHFVGVPEPTEIERKFLLAQMPNLKDIPNPYIINIIETYLTTDKPNNQRKLRSIHSNGHNQYVLTVKSPSPVDPVYSHYEHEHRLTEQEYYSYLGAENDSSRNSIIKTRYRFTWDRRTYGLDVFNSHNNPVNPTQPLCLMEIELTNSKESFNIPPFLNVAKEVTTDQKFYNCELAKRKLPNLSMQQSKSNQYAIENK